MVGEAVKENLYAAAIEGDVAKLQELLLQQFPYLVNEVSFTHSRNLLHVATIYGQVAIVEEVLKINPRLAQDVDSKQSSPLHIAAAQGHVEIAMKLLEAAPEMCWCRDSQGMNLVHIAAVSGHVDILMGMLQLDMFPAMERVLRGQTVLHLCVKHGRLEELQFLGDMLGELVCAKDDDGETLLHLAVRCDQFEILEYLVRQCNIIEKHTPNSMGKTTLQILDETPFTNFYSDMRRILIGLESQSILDTLPKLSDVAMVVVVLIATIAFQAAVSPPGGVLQEDTSSHRAGEAVMASTHPRMYKHFVRANTTAFVSSLVTIFLITTRLPSAHVHFLLIAVCAMWASMASIAVSYGASAMVITPTKGKHDLPLKIIIPVVAISVGILGFTLAYGYVRRLYLLWKGKLRRRDFSTTGEPLIRRVFFSIFKRFNGEIFKRFDKRREFRTSNRNAASCFSAVFHVQRGNARRGTG